MKKYLSFFKIRFIAGMQYRAAAIAGVVTQFVWGMMLLLMYRAFYLSNPAEFPMELSSLASYIWLGQATFSMCALWFFDEEIFSSISSGNIAYEFSRPCDLYSMWFVKNMALRVARCALRAIPMLIVVVFLPEPFRLGAPASLVHALLFLLSMVLALLVIVAFLMLIYISAFYTVSPVGTKIIATTLGDFLAGSIIPLPFFPEWLQPIINALPFAYMQNTPFLIYSGELSLGGAMIKICIQLLWAIALIAIGKLIMRHASRKVCVQGG